MYERQIAMSVFSRVNLFVVTEYCVFRQHNILPDNGYVIPEEYVYYPSISSSYQAVCFKNFHKIFEQGAKPFKILKL